jgi:hypothetical protein
VLYLVEIRAGEVQYSVGRGEQSLRSAAGRNGDLREHLPSVVGRILPGACDGDRHDVGRGI